MTAKIGGILGGIDCPRRNEYHGISVHYVDFNASLRLRHLSILSQPGQSLKVPHFCGLQGDSGLLGSTAFHRQPIGFVGDFEHGKALGNSCQSRARRSG